MKIRDENRIPDLIKQLNNLNRNKVQLGINAPSGDIVYTIAWVHEYGIDIKITDKMRGWFLAQGIPLRKNQTHIKIPERSYFRSGFDANQASINMKAEQLIKQLLEGDITTYQLNEELGDFASRKIRDNVQSVGLVETGELKDSVGFRVVRK